MTSREMIVITGASSGIGQALAHEFHAIGYNVLLVARREDRLKQLCETLNLIRINSATYKVCDLTNREQSKNLAREIAQQTPAGLVNNAGRGSLGMFSDLNLDDELQQIELNVNAPLILTHAVLPAMKKAAKGFIINVSSIMAYQAAPFVATYAATKGFEWLHSLALSRELEDYGIKVLTLCPGPTETEFFGVAKVSDGLNNFKRTSAETVAKSCLNALNKGQRICIPDTKAKLLVLVAKLCPVSIYTFFIKKLLQSKLTVKAN